MATIIAWGCDVVQTARNLGCESNDFSACLRFIVEHLKRFGSVKLLRANFCYLHHSKTPGKAQFFARMRPAWVVCAKKLLRDMHATTRKVHWLGGKISRQDPRPVYSIHKYVLLGKSVWDVATDKFPKPMMDTYGKVGASGSVWWVAVEDNDKQ